MEEDISCIEVGFWVEIVWNDLSGTCHFVWLICLSKSCLYITPVPGECSSPFDRIHVMIFQGASIGPFCTVGASAKLGNHCRLYPGSHVSGNTILGEHCVLLT